MISFELLKNALQNDHLVDYIEKFYLKDDEEQLSPYNLYMIRRSKQHLESVFASYSSAKTNVVLYDDVHNVSVTIHMLIESRDVPQSICDEYRLDPQKRYPVIVTNGSTQHKTHKFTLRNEITTSMSKAKLAFACTSLRVNIGFIINKTMSWGVVDFANDDASVKQESANAAIWAHRFQTDAHTMCADPPSCIELYPNMCASTQNEKASNIKKEMAIQNREMTLVRGIGLKERNIALKKGITRWDDSRLNSDILDLRPNTKTYDIVNAILNSNRKECPVIDPRKISSTCAEGDIFIDIETSSLYEWKDYIFMIGVGYGEDNFKCFTVSTPTFEEERRIVDEFVSEMQDHNAKRMLHWAPHEVNVFKKIENRHSIDVISKFEWVDMCKYIEDIRWCPNGAFTFSLKSIAPAMFKHNMIKTIWTSECQDGLSAMYDSYVAFQTNDVEKLKDIEDYNRVDVVTTMQIWRYLKSIDVCI